MASTTTVNGCVGAALLDMQDSQEQSPCLENCPLERLLLSRVDTASPMCERLLSAYLGNLLAAGRNWQQSVAVR